METQKSYINDRNEATILCPQCGRTKMVNAAQIKHQTTLKAKCLCGVVFMVTFEKRFFYRKEVDLIGQYSRETPPPEGGDINVQDISRTGIGFTTQFKNNLRVDDIVRVKFMLDDSHHSMISKNVVIKRILDRFVGAEFCNQDLGKVLAFYLMP